MSLSICTSCLARLRLSQSSTARLALPTTSSSSFHTSPIQYGDGQSKKKRATGKNVYRILSPQTYGKKKRVAPKTPPIGERQTQRKRIVLSNANALDVQNMPDLNPGNMALEMYVGSMLGLDGNLIDQLRQAQAFKRSQHWKIFRRPATLFRTETYELGKSFERVKESLQGSKPEVLRQVIIGERASGKSILLLQALSMAYLNNWIVINVPEAQEFVTNQSAYAPVPRPEGSEEQQYVQPRLAAELLARLSTSNQAVLQDLRLNHPLPKSLSDNSINTIQDLAILGSKTPTLATQAWEHLLKELTIPGEHPRPPTLVAIDSLDHWMGQTKYHASDYSLIHAHQFTLIKQLLSLLFSNAPFPYGGMVIGATTKSNNPIHPSFDILLKQISSINEQTPMTDANFPMPTPYEQADQRVLSLLTPSPENTTVTQLKGLSKLETASLLRYFTDSGILKAKLSEQFVNEQWTVSSGGIIGELCKISATQRLDPAKIITGFGTMGGIRMGQGEHRGHR